MAGLGETCTHVAALLFTIETIVKLRDSRTVTQEKAYWLLPSCMKNVDYKECKDIDFTSARTLKKKLDQKVDALGAFGDSRKDVLSKKKFRARTSSPTEEEVNDLFKSLAIGGAKCGIFSLVEPYADVFVPNAESDSFPPLLTDFREEAASTNYAELLKRCQEIEKNSHCYTAVK